MSVENSIRAEAASHFMEGYNCPQSVLLTMQKFWNVKKPLEPKVASAFARFKAFTTYSSTSSHGPLLTERSLIQTMPKYKIMAHAGEKQC